MSDKELNDLLDKLRADHGQNGELVFQALILERLGNRIAQAVTRAAADFER